MPDDRALGRFHRRLAVLALMAAGLCALTVALTVSVGAPQDGQVFAAIAAGLGAIVAIDVGIYAWYRRPENRFGPLLVAAGLIWSLTAFAASDGSLLYSVGRVSIWFVEPVLIYLVLAFPSGRVTEPLDRWLFRSAIAIAAVLYIPTAFLVEQYPLPFPLASCGADCPGNFFMLLDSTPGFVEPVRVVREILTSCLFLAVALRLGLRIKSATVLMRRTLVPVLAAAIARLAALAIFSYTRRVAPDSAALDVVGWVWIATLPVMALGFLIGLLRWQLFIADSMQRLGNRLFRRPGPDALRAAMADALEDQSLELAYSSPENPGLWVDASGHPVQLEALAPGRALTEVRDNGRAVVALVHDSALNEQRDFVDAVASLALVGMENHGLTVKLHSSLQELQQSRSRIMAAANSERRRIERDLHDGAQQRLVALRIKLELADDLMDRDPDHAHVLLGEVGPDIDEALGEVRSLARGIYPALLADQGLREALRAAALRAPLSTHVTCDGIGRYSAEIESAVYFSCLESMQNVVKHADGATAISVSVMEDGELRFEVRDDGEGFDEGTTLPGHGLTNMRDRLAAVGGRLSVSSNGTNGTGGTRVAGSIPLE